MSDGPPVVTVQVLTETRELAEVTLEAEIVIAARRLPDDLARYFLPDDRAILLPLDQLLQTRARPEGVRNAVELMRQAYEGHVPRRAPLNVARFQQSYRVLDGNSTVTIAKAAGWRQVPCLIES